MDPLVTLILLPLHFILENLNLNPFMTFTRGRGQAQVDAPVDGWRVPSPTWTSIQKIKISPLTYVILSSSRAKKLASFLNQNVVFGRNKIGTFLSIEISNMFADTNKRSMSIRLVNDYEIFAL